MPTFEFQKLDVYKTAIDFVAIADDVIERLPRGRARLADQINRASTSIVANIAEGAGEFSKQEKARFYRIALRSATECAAWFDVLLAKKLIDTGDYAKGLELLDRVAAMLTRLVQKTGEGAGAGAFAGGDEDA